MMPTAYIYVLKTKNGVLRTRVLRWSDAYPIQFIKEADSSRRGGDACVAHGGRSNAPGERDEGDATAQGVPSPHIHHPRPYGKTGFLPPSLDASGARCIAPLQD